MISQSIKSSQYVTLVKQVEALTEHEPDLVANLANTAAAIKECFGFWWVGFYLVRPRTATLHSSHANVNHDTELVLGPFQGPVACTRIGYGNGVCGSAWQQKSTIVVPDVEKFPGHIACSSASRSEIVVPLTDNNGEVWGVLDIDSADLNTFDHIDALHLEQIAEILSGAKNQ